MNLKLEKRLNIAKKTIIAFMIAGVFLIPNFCMSQNIPDKKQNFMANMDVDSSAALNKNVIFDASKSIVPGDPTKATYHWDFGDNTQKNGINVTHTYQKIGNYHVTLKISAANQTFQATSDIFIYKKSILLLTDQSQKEEQIENLKTFAQNEGVEMNILESFDSPSEFISEEDLTRQMDENLDALNRSDAIILWTYDNVGINTLSRFMNENKDVQQEIFSDKNLYIIDDDIDHVTFTPTLQIFNPKQIIIAKEASLYIIILNEEKNVIHELQQSGQEFKFIDENTGRLSIWNFMTYFVNYLIESGIPDNTIALLLMLPIIATIVVFMRQIIGMNTFGMYTPVIICLTFLILGFNFGMVTLLTALIVGMTTRFALKKVHLLFTAKLSIVMIMITLSLFALLVVGTVFKLFDSDFFSLAIFPMLILGSITEKFTSIQSEAGLWKTLWLTLQTVIIAIVAFLAVGGRFEIGIISFQWDILKNFVRYYPESIFLFILVNIALGKWPGLRLVEYIRFREIFQHNEEE